MIFYEYPLKQTHILFTLSALVGQEFKHNYDTARFNPAYKNELLHWQVF